MKHYGVTLIGNSESQKGKNSEAEAKVKRVARKPSTRKTLENKKVKAE